MGSSNLQKGKVSASIVLWGISKTRPVKQTAVSVRQDTSPTRLAKNNALLAVKGLNQICNTKSAQCVRRDSSIKKKVSSVLYALMVSYRLYQVKKSALLAQTVATWMHPGQTVRHVKRVGFRQQKHNCCALNVQLGNMLR